MTASASVDLRSALRLGLSTPAGRGPRVALPPAVIVGLDSTTGLQTARILARRGVPVTGIAQDAKHPCCRTNVSQQVVIASTGDDGLVDALERLGSELEQPAMLLPCTDMSVLLVSRHRHRLAARYRFILPDHGVIELLLDKERFYRYAAEAGLPIPPTHFLVDRASAEEAAASLRFPCIVKPALKTSEWRRHSRAKAYLASSPAELLQLYERCAAWTRLLIAQEWIEGSDADHYTCNCYFDNASEPLVTFTSRKLRQWPPIGGEGCLSEESRNEAVQREAIRLFQQVGHRGLGYLEMKRDARTGEHLIIEPNVGRPTGRSAGAEAGGVELVFTCYCHALGLPLPANREQRHVGAKWIHIRRDVQSAFYQWSHGQLTLRDWVASWKGARTDALFSWSDPRPFWADCARVARALPAHIRRRGGRSEVTRP